jgi:DNA-binding NtrC family response regulator
METPVILIIDDDKVGRWALSVVLKDAGYETLVAPGEGVLEKVEETDMKPAAVISDYNLSGELDGVEAAQKVSNTIGLSLPTIITACRDDNEAKRRAARAQYLFCSKPMDPNQVLGVLKTVLASERSRHSVDHRGAVAS